MVEMRDCGAKVDPGVNRLKYSCVQRPEVEPGGPYTKMKNKGNKGKQTKSL